MKITCPKCDRWIPTENVNVQRGFVVCHLCQNVYRLAKILPKTFHKPEPRLPLPKPRNFVVLEDKQGIDIQKSWFRLAAVFALPLAIIANGVLIAIMFSVALDPKGPGPIGFVFPLFVPHAWFVIGILYASLVTLVNRTHVQIRNGELIVCHRPIFYWGNYRIPIHDIQQFYCTERNGVWNTQWTTQKNPTYFDLNALLTDGSKIRLLTLPQVDEALFIEQELERHLKIEDRLVTGEVKTLRTPRA